MSNREFLSRPPRRSRSGRLIKEKKPVDETEDKQLLLNERGYSPTDSRNCPRLTRPEKIRCNSGLLLHCINSGPPPGIKRGSTVYMSEGKTRRKLVATVLSVESANHNDAPYRDYGDQWQSYMTNSKTALPALVFK